MANGLKVQDDVGFCIPENP